MHELGICSEIVKTLKDVMKEENLKEITEITITAGEATGLVPRYIYECWPAVIEGVIGLDKSIIKVEMIEVFARCHECENEFLLRNNHGKCPKCQSEDYDLINGYEFEITKIIAS